MCLLMYKPAGVDVPVAHLTRAAQVHPHGFGLAWPARDGTVNLWRSVDNAVEWVRRAQALRDVPAVLHARWATHGPKIKANCHPARVPGRQDLVVGHNGVLRSVPDCKAGRSDTRVFIDHVLGWMQGDWYRDPILLNQLNDLIGKANKMAVLDGQGHVALLNESSGEWDAGVWYSNDSYQTVSKHLTRTRGGYRTYGGMYGHAWDDDYSDVEWGPTYSAQRTTGTGTSAAGDACTTGSCDQGILALGDAAEPDARLIQLGDVLAWLVQTDANNHSLVCDACWQENLQYFESFQHDSIYPILSMQGMDREFVQHHGGHCEYCNVNLLED